MEPYIIRPGIGVNDIKLGFNRAKVKSLIGEPRSFEHMDDDGSGVCWYYDRHKFSIEFWRENCFNASAIDVFDSDILLFDRYLPKNSHIMMVRNVIHNNVSMNDIYEEDQVDLYEINVNHLGLCLWFENSLLSSVRIF